MSEMSKKAEHVENGEIGNAAPAIAALDARVAELALQHEQAASSSQEKTQSYLEERLAGIGEQLDAVRHSTDAMTKRAEASAADVAKKESRLVEERVATLVGEARTLMAQSAPSDSSLTTIRGEIESLNQRFDDIKAESASDRDVQSLKLAIEQLNSNVAADPTGQPGAAMEQRLAELTHRLDETTTSDQMGPHFADLEQRIVGLDQKLATAMVQQGDGAAFAALESQISVVGERMSATEEKLGALTTIEQSISQLYAAIEENKVEVQTVAEGAATQTANEIMQQGQPVGVETGPSPELVALEEGLAAVRQSSHAAEQHNQETLEAVHETLEQIITKLADMEAGEAMAVGGQQSAPANTGGTDWQAAVQSHLHEAAAPQDFQPTEQPHIEPVTDHSPAFNPGPLPDMTPPDIAEPVDFAGQPESDLLQQPEFQPDNLVQPDFDQAPQGQSEAGQSPLDYIAQARLASQSASTQSTGPISKSAGFFTEKIMSARNSNDENSTENSGQNSAENRGKKKTKSLFSLPFLTKKKIQSDNDQLTAEPVVNGESKASRKRLIMAGLMLLIAAGAFVFSKSGGNSTGDPAPTASVQEKLVEPRAAPAESAVKTPVPEKSSQKTRQAPELTKLVRQASLTIPQNIPNPLARSVTADQTGMPAARALENTSQRPDPVASAPTDRVTTANLPPAPSASHKIQSPLNIQTAARSALPPEAAGTIELRQAAAKGDSSAQFVIATRYADGKLVTRDYAKAAEWYQMAASKGLAPAQYRLGTLFERGNGVPKDLNAARLWYERAAEKGNVKAMHNLAVIYASPNGGLTDYGKAKKWFTNASNYGLKDSQFNLAVVHERGLAGLRDQKEAYYWYLLAAAQGDRDAGVKAHTLKNHLSEADIKLVAERQAAWRPLPTEKQGNFVAIKDTKWRVTAKTPTSQTWDPNHH